MKRLSCLSALSLLTLSACLGSQAPAPVSTYGGGQGAGSAGSHVVQEGDTLWSISNRYDIVMRDIAFANKLRAPFMLDEGQRLTLPPPPKYKVRSGDTLYEISRLFNTSTSEIARLNDLPAPYTIKPGQTLRLPSVRPKPAVAQPTSKPVQLANTRGAVVKPVQSQPLSQGTAQKPSTAQQPQSVQKASIVKPVKVTTPPPKRSSSKFLTPVDGKVLSSYGPKDGGLHNDGVNIAAAKGTPVMAAENGVVVYVGNELKGSGNLILIRHEDRYMSAYAHLDQFMIKRGDTVKRGQTIGTVGSTGAVSSPQLHFEIRKGTKAIDPKGYIAG